MKTSRKIPQVGKSAAKPQLTLVPNVFNLAELRAKSAASSEAHKNEVEVVQALKELLEHAKAGYITGFAFIANYTDDNCRRHDVGATGKYLTDPVLLLGAASKLVAAANAIDTMEGAE